MHSFTAQESQGLEKADPASRQPNTYGQVSKKTHIAEKQIAIKENYRWIYSQVLLLVH